FLHISNVVSTENKGLETILKPDQEVVVKIFRASPTGYKVSLKDVPENITSKILKNVHQNQQIVRLFEIAGKNAKIANPQIFLQRLLNKYDEVTPLFEEAAENGLSVFEEEGIPSTMAKELTKMAQAKFKQKKVVISKRVKIESKKPNGLAIIKTLLQNIEKSDCNIVYLGGGTYLIKTQTPDPKNAEKNLNNSLHEIRKKVDVCEIISDKLSAPTKKC
ncbi:MAG: hypothetical protein CVU81_01115, partial [Euryarchaeota archaeon HGW-Euryarchaeota-1]